MKGTPDAPACGFSARTVAVLQSMGTPFAAVDILPDPRIRQELSALSQLADDPAAVRRRRAGRRRRHRRRDVRVRRAAETLGRRGRRPPRRLPRPRARPGAAAEHREPPLTDSRPSAPVAARSTQRFAHRRGLGRRRPGRRARGRRPGSPLAGARTRCSSPAIWSTTPPTPSTSGSAGCSRRSGVPTYVLPGNHDDRATIRRHFGLPGAGAEPDSVLGRFRRRAAAGRARLPATRRGLRVARSRTARLARLRARRGAARRRRWSRCTTRRPSAALRRGTRSACRTPIATALGEVVGAPPTGAEDRRRARASHVHRELAGRPTLTIPSTFVQARLNFCRRPASNSAKGRPGFAVHTVVDGGLVSHMSRFASCRAVDGRGAPGCSHPVRAQLDRQLRGSRRSTGPDRGRRESDDGRRSARSNRHRAGSSRNWCRSWAIELGGSAPPPALTVSTLDQAADQVVGRLGAGRRRTVHATPPPDGGRGRGSATGTTVRSPTGTC